MGKCLKRIPAKKTHSEKTDNASTSEQQENGRAGTFIPSTSSSSDTL